MLSIKKAMAVFLAVVLGALIAVPAIAGQNAPASTSPLPVPGLLDGKIFDGKLSLKNATVNPANDPEKKETMFSESIEFKDGMLISEFFTAKGYAPFSYSAKKDGSGIRFMATSKGSDNPKLVLKWEGTVRTAKTTNEKVLTATVKLMQDTKALEEYAVDCKLRAPVETPTAK